MSKPIKIEFDASKLDRTLAKAVGERRYYKLIAWPLRNGPDERSNSHLVKQDLPKDAEKRDMPILGHLKLNDASPSREKEAPQLRRGFHRPLRRTMRFRVVS